MTNRGGVTAPPKMMLRTIIQILKVMIITGHSGVFSIHQLTETQVDVLLAVAYTADKRCFERQDEDGSWYSNDDFILSLTDQQRTALAKLGEAIELIYGE